MKKIILTLCVLLGVIGLKAQEINLYDFTVTDISGEEFKMSQLEGKKVLIVNTASKCGLTPQYEILEEVYKEYGGDNFVIIGFPANNFGAQEPGTDKEIEGFCQKNYGVSFPMMSKISVKGNDIHVLYQWLTMKAKNGIEDAEVKWNFQKFMIDEKGNYVSHVAPQESPACDVIINWIKG